MESVKPGIRAVGENPFSSEPPIENNFLGLGPSVILRMRLAPRASRALFSTRVSSFGAQRKGAPEEANTKHSR